MRRFPNPNVLSRFPGYAPSWPAEGLLTAPSGSAQITVGQSVPSPLPVAMIPTAGAFVRLAPAAAYSGDEVPQYIPAYTPEGAIGVSFAIGLSAIGWHKPYHGTLTVTSGGVTVETP